MIDQGLEHRRAGARRSRLLYLPATPQNPLASLRHPVLLTAFGAIGVVVGFFYAGSVGWGPPGTAAYDTYQSANRIVGLLALVLVAGVVALGRTRWRVRGAGWRGAWMAVLVGAILLLAGNVIEFWLFMDRPYGDGLRDLGWMAFVVGAGVSLLGGLGLALATGATAVRSQLARADRVIARR